ncbi:MAG TPA: FAD-dependent oxidoreductase [Candidatus Binatia bacterium]|nr:FAD-dependent oxidoreductase [Candidatus Binatia bacterium]
MPRDPRFDPLFQPMKIGPKTARNRFYQVPHCSGMGYDRPNTLAAMRGMKAEGGWAVVSTEYCSIDPASDDTPYPYATLWDEGDIRAHAKMTEAVHRHGSLAAVELWLGGDATSNLNSRKAPISLTGAPVMRVDPLQARVLDREDIREIRRWHVEAARRAEAAGFDIVYVYACHHYLLHTFLSPASNPRNDEYGGNAENRVRLVKELLGDVKDAVGGRLAVAIRWSADSGSETGDQLDPERLEMAASLNGLPDLWDVVIDDYGAEMGVSRFHKEGALEPKVAQLRKVVTGPLVTVGRYTSPESMLRLLKSGTADFVGAARPSIADPFLPRKIEEGRLDDIRECIGCNICYAHNSLNAPIRCTQNPTMGEEWRRGWHPEIIPAAKEKQRVLVVGGGPAGLEAALALGHRGFDVALAERARRLGGRINLKATLPGFAEWARVRDWRESQIAKLGNIEVFRESPMTAESVLEFGAARVVIATGSAWRKDGFSRLTPTPPLAEDAANVFAPEEVIRGALDGADAGPILIYDDERYVMGGALALKLIAAGRRVIYATPAAIVSEWTDHTNEQPMIQGQLMEANTRLLFGKVLAGFDGTEVELTCLYTGRHERHAVAALVPVTARRPDRDLYNPLAERRSDWAAAGIRSVDLIGDAEAPGSIAHAVYSGHRLAREIEDRGGAVPRDRAA